MATEFYTKLSNHKYMCEIPKTPLHKCDYIKNLVWAWRFTTPFQPPC